MKRSSTIPGWKDHVLFTPGPLTTSQTVKLAMLTDYGSRDNDFIDVVQDIRRRLITQVAGLDPAVYTAVLMQGCGSMGVESVIGSVIPPMGTLVVVNNGAYGKRMVEMANILNIHTIELAYPDDQLPDLEEIDRCLKDNNVTHLAMVHCETTSGIMNPIQAAGQLAHQHQVSYIVDAMSSFGAVEIDFQAGHIDYLISSANKCVEGVPGFSFILARTDALLQTDGYARSLCMSLLDQYQDMENHGYFRYTPATHTLLAFQQALNELAAEGGVSARGRRYQQNHERLIGGMRQLGFRPIIDAADQGYIITSFYYLDHEQFDFDTFYQLLHQRGYVIYPGKLTDTECFRVANIGRIFESDVADLLAAMRAVLDEMKVPLSAGS